MTGPEADRDALIAALDRGDRPAAFALARDWMRRDLTPQDLYNGILFPALAHIGIRWERNEIGIAEEHVATEIVRQIVTLHAAQQAPSGPAAGGAIVGCVPGELHDIPGLALSILLERDGWNVRFFGRSVPAEDIIAYAAKVRPAIVCLVAKTIARIDAAIRLVDGIRHAAAGVRIMIGGIDNPACRAVLRPHVDAFADCPVTGAETARRLLSDA